MESLTAAIIGAVLRYSLLQLRVVEGCSKIRKNATQKGCSQETARLRQEQEKLDADRNILFDVIVSTLLELNTSGNWNDLQRKTEELAQDLIVLETTRIDHEYLKQRVALLYKELKENKRDSKNTLRKVDDRITELKDKSQDEIVNSKMRQLYAEKWMNAKAELLELQYKKPPKEIRTKAHEERIHEELLKMYEIQIQEREKLIDHWRIKYAADICDITEKVAVRRSEVQIISAQRSELQNKFDSRSKEMNSWLEIKRQRAELLAAEEKKRRAATNVQAWWRGTMVRRAIGSFKHLRNTSSKKPPSKSKKK